MKGNLKGKKAERFMMYPRFLQMIFDEQFYGLERGVVTRDLKMLNENTFSLMLQNREGKYIFRGVHLLRKFGQFAEIEDFAVDEPDAPNVVVHDDKDVFEVPSPEQEAGSQIAIDTEIEIVFDVETEIAKHQIQIDMQQDLFNSENFTALLQSVQRRVEILPSTTSFDKQDELVDAGADLALRKRRRRDPRLGIDVYDIQMPQVQIDTTTTTEPTEKSTEPTQIEIEQTGPTIRILDYDSYLTGDQGTSMRSGRGKTVLPKNEPIDIPKLQRRVSEIEQQFLSHSIQIEELGIDNAQKDIKIKSLETDVGHLTTIVLDLKQKLQDKFQAEFTNESSPNAISASTSAPELTQAEKDNVTPSHEEGLRRYFAGETGFKVSTKKFRELLIMKEKRSQPEKDARKIKSTRFHVDVEHNNYNLEEDRKGIVYWDYDALKEMWWIRMKLSRRIEYYTHPFSFQFFKMVDLIELAGKNFFNPMKVQKGEIYNTLQQHVRSGFTDMNVAKSVRVKKKFNSLGNPLDVNIFEVKWPPTERVKRIPILSDLPEGLLENFKFWAFDPEAHGVIINCGEQEYSFCDPVDLMCFSEKDSKFLSSQEIKVDHDHLQDALEFVIYTRKIVKTEAWSGGKESVSSFLFTNSEVEKLQEEDPTDTGQQPEMQN
ncbi:hypothetical protein R6Q57_018512 [Mikania cordata]